MSDENDIRFRDECAMRVLEAILSRDEAKTALNLMIQNSEPDSNKKWFEAGLEKVETYARISYKIADLMRKARLASFE